PAQPVRLALSIAILDYDILCFNVSQVPQTSEKCAQVRVGVGGSKQQHADARNPLALLRACRERPRDCRAAEERNEVAALHLYAHSITSSASSRRSRGIVNPSVLAVLRLIASSNLVGCSIGMSPGLAPLRILPTNTAACLNSAGRSVS